MRHISPYALPAMIALVASAAFACAAPVCHDIVRTRIDFAAPAKHGYANLKGSIILEGHRSILSKLINPLSEQTAGKALLLAVNSSIRKAGSPELSGLSEGLPRWGRGLEKSCSEALAAIAGGSWTARIVDGFELAPSGPPEENSPAIPPIRA